MNGNAEKYHFTMSTNEPVHSELGSSLIIVGSDCERTVREKCEILINKARKKKKQTKNGFQPLTIITKRSMSDVAAALDPPVKAVR